MADPLGAIRLDGPPQSARALHVSAYNLGTSSFSVDVAFYCLTGNGGPLVTKHDTVSGWSVQVVSGRIYLLFNNLTYVTDISNLDDGIWHFCRVCVDRITQRAFVFVDGGLDGSLDITGQASVDNTVDLLVGVSGSVYHVGGVAEIRVSTQVRSSSPYIQDVRQYTDDAFTVALFHFNEGMGDISYDMSTIRNDLQLLPIDQYPTYIQSPYEVSPVTVVREQVWRSLDIYRNLTQFLAVRNGKKYRYRGGDTMPTLLTPQNTPALTVIPTAMPDIKPETSAFHKIVIPLQIEGWLYHEEVSEVEFFWWLCLRSLFANYLEGSTAGRFNYIRVENMYSRGPSYYVQMLTDKLATAQQATLFSNFKDIVTFEVRQDLFGRS